VLAIGAIILFVVIVIMEVMVVVVETLEAARELVNYKSHITL
jgi:hypothetical protein